MQSEEVNEWIEAHAGRMIVKVPKDNLLDLGTHVLADLGESEEAMMAILRAFAMKEDGLGVVYGGDADE